MEDCMEDCIYDTYCGLCNVLMAYKTGHKSEFASFWTETTLEAFLKSRGINYEKNDFKLQCQNFRDKTAIIG